MSNEKEINNEGNDNLNFNDVSEKTVKGLDSLKKGFLSAMDVAKNKGQKVFEDAKSNLSKTTEEKLAEAEKKLKSKLEENEKKVKLKLESEERIRQMKKDAEERKKQEKIDAKEKKKREKVAEKQRLEREKEEEKLRIEREKEEERLRIEKERDEQLEKERARREKEEKEKERIRAINREKRKPLMRTIKVILVLVILGFIGFKVYQLISFEKETERQKQLKMIEMDKQKEIAEIEMQKQKELAEIEARKQIEIASITEAEKKKRRDKDGFDIETNENINIRLYDFSIPNYWSENKSKKDSYDGIAEIGTKIAELRISSLEDTENVSYDLLKKLTTEEKMQELFNKKGWYEGAEFVNYEKVSTDILDGYIYKYLCKYKDNEGIVEVLCFPSIEDNRWYYIGLRESNNTDFSYVNDFKKIIDAIKKHN